MPYVSQNTKILQQVGGADVFRECAFGFQASRK